MQNNGESRGAAEETFCHGSMSGVQSSPLASDAGAYVKGGRVWLQTTVYVSGPPAGGYGTVRMRGSRGYAIAPRFHSTVGYRRSSCIRPSRTPFLLAGVRAWLWAPMGGGGGGGGAGRGMWWAPGRRAALPL